MCPTIESKNGVWCSIRENLHVKTSFQTECLAFLASAELQLHETSVDRFGPDWNEELLTRFSWDLVQIFLLPRWWTVWTLVILKILSISFHTHPHTHTHKSFLLLVLFSAVLCPISAPRSETGPKSATRHREKLQASHHPVSTDSPTFICCSVNIF